MSDEVTVKSIPTTSVPVASKNPIVLVVYVIQTAIRRASVRDVGWVVKGFGLFVVLIGIGMCGALFLYGWPSFYKSAAPPVTNWQMMEMDGKMVVEVREFADDGALTKRVVDVPVTETDPVAWVVKEFGEQKPLVKPDTSLDPISVTGPDTL